MIFDSSEPIVGLSGNECAALCCGVNHPVNLPGPSSDRACLMDARFRVSSLVIRHTRRPRCRCDLKPSPALVLLVPA